MTPVATERLRYLARLNPGVPAGVRSDPSRDLPYLPMDALGEDWSLRFDQNRPVSAVLAGNSYFENGDILFAKVTPCFENGKAALVSGVPGGSAFGTTEVTVVRPSPRVESKFLFYVLVAADFQQRGRAEMTGTGGLRRVPDRTVLNYRVPLHPRDKQKAIVAYLDRETAEIEAFIADQEQLVTLLEERRVAAVSSLLDIRQSTPTPVRRVITALGQGWSPEADSRPATADEWGVLKVGCVNSGLLDVHENKALLSTSRPRPELSIKKGDVLVSRGNTRELVGSAAHAASDSPTLMISDLLYRIRTNAQVMRPDFLAQALRTPASRAQIEASAKGTSSSMQKISQGDLLNIVVPVPTLQEQTEAMDRLRIASRQLDATIADAREAIALSKERRAALISAAVTGKIDVREHGKVNA